MAELMPLLWHKARGHYAHRTPDDLHVRWHCRTCRKRVRRAEDGVRTIAVVALVLLMAAAGLLIALELARKPLKDEFVDIRVHPSTSTPGPPVADWRPPQHRWETNHR